MIPGGYNNYIGAQGFYSFAAGSNSVINTYNSFVWNDGSSGAYNSITSNIVQFHAQNGLRLDGGSFQGSIETPVTKTNTFNGPVAFNTTNITVNGTTGGTSNVFMGGVTLHFVNGFFTGFSTP